MPPIAGSTLRSGPNWRNLRFTTTPFITGFPLRSNRQSTQRRQSKEKNETRDVYEKMKLGWQARKLGIQLPIVRFHTAVNC